MVYLLIGVVGGLISALIASSKGRSALGWAVAGFLAPLIAIIVLLVMAPATRSDKGHDVA